MLLIDWSFPSFQKVPIFSRKVCYLLKRPANMRYLNKLCSCIFILNPLCIGIYEKLYYRDIDLSIVSRPDMDQSQSCQSVVGIYQRSSFFLFFPLKVEDLSVDLLSSCACGDCAWRIQPTSLFQTYPWTTRLSGMAIIPWSVMYPGS